MAKDAFDFSDVFRDIETKVDKFMRDKATHEVAQRMMAEMTYPLVYAKYPESPTGYERRYEEGGLADYRNYEPENDGWMTLTIHNVTQGNARYHNSDGWDPDFITDISIEPGVGYHWRNSLIYRRMPYPRPFMEKALDHFVDDYLLDTIHNTFFDD